MWALSWKRLTDSCGNLTGESTWFGLMSASLYDGNGIQEHLDWEGETVQNVSHPFSRLTTVELGMWVRRSKDSGLSTVVALHECVKI